MASTLSCDRRQAVEDAGCLSEEGCHGLVYVKVALGPGSLEEVASAMLSSLSRTSIGVASVSDCRSLAVGMTPCVLAWTHPST
jgi:hypothetical protein